MHVAALKIGNIKNSLKKKLFLFKIIKLQLATHVHPSRIKKHLTQFPQRNQELKSTNSKKKATMTNK